MVKATKTIKTRVINLEQKQGAFSTLLNRFRGESKEQTELSALRSILSNEKARLLHMAKTKKPDSIYKLAKDLGRDFKAVRQDVLLLERFGFLERIPVKKGGREMLKPVLALDTLEIKINL